MCYNIAYLEKKLKKLADRYKEVIPENIKINERELPLYYFVSGFSNPALPVINNNGVLLLDWGLIPFWIKSEKEAAMIKNKTLNAKGETLFEKPSFKAAVKYRRCLLPVSGFFEWREVKKIKYPYFIKHTGETIFSLGCIHDEWTNKETGEVKQTFSIITTEANPLMAKIHNRKKRMPLIIPRSKEKEWINPRLEETQIKRLINPIHESNLEAYTVSRTLNNPKNNRNTESAIEKVNYQEIELF